MLIVGLFGISTKKSYDKLDMGTCDHPNIKKLVNALNKGQDFNKLLGNSLEQPSISIKQDILKIKKLVKM